MELHERIALARKQAGLSQEQLGEKLGVSRQAVSKWESGQSNPDVAYVAGMCRLFGVSSDWLLLGEETAQTSAPARCSRAAAHRLRPPGEARERGPGGNLRFPPLSPDAEAIRRGAHLPRLPRSGA